MKKTLLTDVPETDIYETVHRDGGAEHVGVHAEKCPTYRRLYGEKTGSPKPSEAEGNDK